MTNHKGNDPYPQFIEAMKERFATFSQQPLFKTNAEHVYQLFLDHLPASDRQEFDCSCCRHFVKEVGGLVVISETGETTSVLWNEEEVPDYFVPAVKAMREAVEQAKVTGVFLTQNQLLGTAFSGGWEHMSAALPRERVYVPTNRTAKQQMARFREQFPLMLDTLDAFSPDVTANTLALLETELYRGDSSIATVQWYQRVQEQQAGAERAHQKRNLLWKAIATAANGFTHMKNNSIGTLMQDIKNGVDTDVAVRKFKSIMDPSRHQRSQVAPTVNQKREAEKVVRQLGIQDSLPRAFAEKEDIPASARLWEPTHTSQPVSPISGGGIFDHVPTRGQETTTAPQVNLPTSVMTWDKFQRTILDSATKMEVLVDNPTRFMALVKAVDETAPNIFKWGNKLSWYYDGGVDGEIKRRVEAAGGRYENNEIRFSLIWDGITDLDAHCRTPHHERINFSSKRDSTGGWLDIDMNGGDHRNENPVENIRWEKNAPEGRYEFKVHNYKERVNYRGTSFKAELEINGKTYTHHGVSLPNDKETLVFVFDYKKGQDPSFIHAPGAAVSSVQPTETWGLEQNTFVPVNLITLSPNLWGEQTAPQVGHHVFFLLEGCRDEEQGKGRGFYTEMLKTDLREIRKTLDAYTEHTPIQNAEQATACGVGYAKDVEWNVTVKVTTKTGTRLIKIDRFD